MPYPFDFRTEYRYLSAKGITIPVILTTGGRTVDCRAKIDTGAEYCLFQRELAEGLELGVETGELISLDTLGGLISAYGHHVTMQTLGLTFEVMVYFAAHQGMTRNLLGRHGWLEQVRLGLIDHDELLYLSPYNE